MGKSGKRKKQGSEIDFEALTAVESPADDGGGWHTGPAAMVLDGGDGGGGDGGGGGEPEEAIAGDEAMAAATGSGREKARKKRKKGGRRGGGGDDAMDTSEAGGRGGTPLGVRKGAGTKKVAIKRGSKTALQLKRKAAKQDKALAVSEKLEARAAGRLGKKQRKAALKALY